MNQSLNKLALPIAACGIAVPAAISAQGPAQTRPNIVLMIADDCRYLDLGCYGSPDAITPNIDRLASEGLRFERFFQATAMSSPTRHCLLTGLYPVRSGAYPNHTFIGEGVRTLPDYLRESGYRVAMQGKRHINPISSFPFEYLGRQTDVDMELIEPFISDVAQTGEPFFLYVASNDPHSPWTRGDQSLFDPDRLTLAPNLVDGPVTRRQYANYLAEINQLDSDLGLLEELLARYGLDGNTIFIFTSEQGYSFPFAKWTCYDAGLRTGFIVRWNGVTSPGSTTAAMCEYVDVTPTLLDIAGVRTTEELDGRSFLPVLRGEAEDHKEYVYGIQTTRGIINGSDHYAVRSVRDARFSFILNLTPEVPFDCASTTDRDIVWAEWNRIAASDPSAGIKRDAYRIRPAEELYDIVNDPFQMTNLAADPVYSADKERLRGKLTQWMRSQGDRGQQTEMEALEHKWNPQRAAQNNR